MSAESRPVKRGEGCVCVGGGGLHPLLLTDLLSMKFYATWCLHTVMVIFMRTSLSFFFFFGGVGGESVLKLRKDSPHPLLKILDLGNLPPSKFVTHL